MGTILLKEKFSLRYLGKDVKVKKVAPMVYKLDGLFYAIRDMKREALGLDVSRGIHQKKPSYGKTVQWFPFSSRLDSYAHFLPAVVGQFPTKKEAEKHRDKHFKKAIPKNFKRLADL